MGNYNYILEGLRAYGSPKVFGSAHNGREYINNHDIDIGLITEFKSKKFLKEKCIEIIKEYGALSLPLHFIIIGEFDLEYQVIEDRGVSHLIQFVPIRWKYPIWFTIILKKWLQSLWRKS